MMVFGAFLVFLFLTASALGGIVTNVNPEYLDMLLNTKQYDEFAELMGIEDVNHVIPKEGERTENPMFNKDLEFGDIMMTKESKEDARQGIRFDRYPGSKWPNGKVPYWVKPDDYNDDQKRTIKRGIDRWNERVSCIKLTPWESGDRDYVYVFSGNGCWSYMGRQDNGQYLSLQQNGCVWVGTVIHEFMHAIGIHHEQCRHDRDNHVDILWDNIPDEWKSQYEKTNPDDFGLQSNYDYYSVMHYPYHAPGTNKPAFNVKANGINTNRMGRGNDFTDIDVDKINILYC